MALDRSKFKATNVAATIQKDKELSDRLGRDGGVRTDYLKFDNGTNLIRIYPPHPEEDGGGDVFAEPEVTVFLPMMVVQKDDKGEEMVDPKTRRPILKESVRSVFNSRVHGGTEKDLVEEYINFSRARLEEDIKNAQDTKMKGFSESKLEAITGNFQKKIQGLKYKQAWAMYVDKIVGSQHKFGLLEIGPAVKDRLNSIAASTDTSNDPLATDPFTDIENGRAIIVNYNKEAKKPADYYKTELDNSTVVQTIAGKNYQLPRTFPLSDDQLERFSMVAPLAKRFRNCFKKRDFELQLEGLEFFDTKHQIGTFEDPTWLAICEEIEAYYPDEETTEQEGDDQSGEPLGATTAPVQQEPEGDQFDLMTRKELSTWLKNNKTGILVKPTMTDDQVRDLARNWVSQQEETSFDVQGDEALQEEASVETQHITAQTTSASDRLAAMRAKMGGKK